MAELVYSYFVCDILRLIWFAVIQQLCVTGLKLPYSRRYPWLSIIFPIKSRKVGSGFSVMFLRTSCFSGCLPHICDRASAMWLLSFTMVTTTLTMEEKVSLSIICRYWPKSLLYAAWWCEQLPECTCFPLMDLELCTVAERPFLRSSEVFKERMGIFLQSLRKNCIWNNLQILYSIIFVFLTLSRAFCFLMLPTE